MALEERRTCCFTGHRPDKLPWGNREDDPRCFAIKRSLAREAEGLYRRGFRHFISGMAMGCDLYFAEAALSLRERCAGVTLEGAVPCATQPDRWPNEQRQRWQTILSQCDFETLIQQHYDRWCMQPRDRYMVERSAAILAVFNGTSGGTQYTLNQAMNQGLSIFLLDPLRPDADAIPFQAP